MANASSNATLHATSANPTFSTPPLNQLLNQTATIKLDRRTFLVWQNLAMPILKSYRLLGHLNGEYICPKKCMPTSNNNSTDGNGDVNQSTSSSSSTRPSTIVNPLYESWVVIDQLLLGWLYNSMNQEVAIAT